MRNYLQAQTIGNILRNTFVIYGKGFAAIFLIYFLPIVPFEVWQAEAKAANNTGLFVLGYTIGMVANLFIVGAIAIAVSDICVGNKPSVARSYKRIFSTIPGKLLVTNLLTTMWSGRRGPAASVTLTCPETRPRCNRQLSLLLLIPSPD